MINEDILIDRNNLDVECEEAPGYYDYWENQEAYYETERERYEAEQQKKIRGTTERRLREEYGITKITDAAVNSVIKSDPTYTNLTRQYNQAKANRLSWGRKISILDTLARLHSSGYFAKIESKPVTKSVVAEQMADRIRKKIAALSKQRERRKR